MSPDNNNGLGPDGRPLFGGGNPPNTEIPNGSPQTSSQFPRNELNPNGVQGQAQGAGQEGFVSSPPPNNQPGGQLSPPPPPLYHQPYGQPGGVMYQSSPVTQAGFYSEGPPPPYGQGGSGFPPGPPPFNQGQMGDRHPPIRRNIPPSSGEPKKKSFFSWPLVILVLGLLAIGSCTYSVTSMVSGSSFTNMTSFSSLYRPGVAVLVIEGEISDTSWAVSAFKSFEKDENVKAIVLRVNSPGGAVAPCQELYRAMRASKKPIVVSMGSMAASGGLYLAVAGSHIMANPGTMTGSIGVIMETIEVDQVMDKLGIKAQVIKSGQFKDIGSPFRPMEPIEQTMLQTMVMEIYEQFVNDVAAGRPKMTIEKVRSIADGRIFTGNQALSLGLVDSIGGLQEAIDKAMDLGGITDKDKAQVISEDGRGSLLEELLGVRLGFLDKVDSSLQTGPTLKFLYRPGLF
ncbi:MAG: signal peptide peptidase SppA [Deltaproteobacteria bacterium]|jgi:protease-4|nr:signal peptide peptidase SppA [Deltaproteobacteria bacterium]